TKANYAVNISGLDNCAITREIKLIVLETPMNFTELHIIPTFCFYDRVMKSRNDQALMAFFKEWNYPLATDMPITSIRSLRNPTPLKEVLRMVGHRTFAAGAAKKKGSKGGAASTAPKASLLTKEVKSTTVFGANILKDGQDPKILPDSEYPDWLWLLLDKKPALSELRRKDVENLPFEDLKRFVKLDNRARIKENNSLRAKN
ncbi:mitochondrial ribosomal protein L37, partial [Striga asiatica]